NRDCLASQACTCLPLCIRRLSSTIWIVLIDPGISWSRYSKNAMNSASVQGHLEHRHDPGLDRLGQLGQLGPCRHDASVSHTVRHLDLPRLCGQVRPHDLDGHVCVHLPGGSRPPYRDEISSSSAEAIC